MRKKDTRFSLTEYLKPERILRLLSMDYTSLGCCTLAFLLYFNTLNSGFVYDDRRVVLSNTDVVGNTRWEKMFFNDYWGTSLKDSGSHGSYRPLSVLSFRLNYLLGGLQPWGYHLINNLMHCLATGLVVKLAQHLFISYWAVLVTGALFAAHPIHTEAVAGIVGRADLAACIFYILTFLCYVRHLVWREKRDDMQWLALLGTVVLSLMALLFKETAITVLAMCALFDVVRGVCGVNDKHRLRSVAILLLALAAIVYCRLMVLPQPQTAFSSADNPIAKTNCEWTRTLTFLYLPAFNFYLMIYPRVLSFDWGMEAIPRITSLADWRNALTLMFYGGLLWLCKKIFASLLARIQFIARLRKKPADHQQRAHRNTARASHNHDQICADCKQELHAANAATHAPNCRILNNNNNNYSNCFCHQMLAANGPVNFISMTLRRALAAVRPSYARSISTSSNITTGSNHSAASAGRPRCCHIAMQHSACKNCSCYSADCSDLLLCPQQVPVHTVNACALVMALAFLILPFLPATNLFFYVGFVVAERVLYLPSVGYCLLVGYGFSKLLETCRVGRGQKRRLAILLSLCLVLSLLSARTMQRNMDWRDEESLYRSAVTVNPPKALGNLGSILSSQGRYAEAKTALKDAIKHRPNMADVHYNLGILHQNQREYTEAIKYFQNAIQYRPKFISAHLNLGVSLLGLGKSTDASFVFYHAIRLDGTGVRDRAEHETARAASFLHFGAIFEQQGKLKHSLAVYKEALQTVPVQYQQRDVLYSRMGDIFTRLQQWSDAEKYHRMALQLQPQQVSAHISYGNVLAKNRSKLGEAEIWFKRALQLAPQQSSVYHHYAEFLSSQERENEAIGYRLHAISLSPDDYTLTVAVAKSMQALYRLPEAEIYYRKAVELRPNDETAQNNLDAILNKIREFNEHDLQLDNVDGLGNSVKFIRYTEMLH